MAQLLVEVEPQVQMVQTPYLAPLHPQVAVVADLEMERQTVVLVVQAVVVDIILEQVERETVQL